MERTLAQARAQSNRTRSKGKAMAQDGVTENRERYDQAFALMDNSRGQVLAFLRSVTQTQADRRPAENEWSVGEIAHHLAITERDMMARVADHAANARANEYDYGEILKKRPFRIEDSWDISVTGKGEAPPQLIPTAGKSLAELVRGLEDARAHSRQLLAPYRNEDLGVKFFIHRRLGLMTLYERLAFTAYHDLKHLKQMERALARVRT